MATDPITGVTSPRPVTDLIRHLEDHAWVSVTVVSDSGSEVLQATAEHPFFVTTAPTAFYPGQVAIKGGWVNAADLVVGDVVRTADGGSAVVAGVTVAPVTEDTLDWAFNLTIANDHTYYVGDEPVLVHNARPEACDLTLPVGEVLTKRTASILKAPLPKGTPGWEALRPMTMGSVKDAARTQRGMKTVWKLLNDNRFRRPGA